MILSSTSPYALLKEFSIACGFKYDAVFRVCLNNFCEWCCSYYKNHENHTEPLNSFLFLCHEFLISLYYYFTIDQDRLINISFISFKYKQDRLRLEHLQPTLRH